MAASDEVIRLLLDMGVSAQNVQAVTKASEELKAQIESLDREMVDTNMTTQEWETRLSALRAAFRDQVSGLEGIQGAASSLGESYEVLERNTVAIAAANTKATTTAESYALALTREEQATDRAVQAAMRQTQSQKAINQVLDESTAATHVFSTAATGAIGEKSAGGRGLLGFSYAVQDFASVISNGGPNALPRALMAVSNNVDQMGMAAGLSAAKAAALSLSFTGLTVALPLLTGLFELAWEAISGEENFEVTKERLKEIQEELKKTHEAFQKLAQAPTDFEKESAATIRMLLEERPAAQRAKEAVARGLTEDEATAALTGEERGQIKSDRNVELEAAASAVRRGTTYQEELANQKKERDDIRKGLLFGARRRRAEQIVTGSAVAGPAGMADRNALLRLTQGVPGLEALQGASPDAIEANEADADRMDQQNREIEESGKAIGNARKAAAAREKDLARRQVRAKRELDALTNDQIRSGDAEQREAERNRAMDRDNAAGVAKAAGKAGDPLNQKRLDEARQGVAARIQAQVMQQGGATANQAARLQRLQEQLGTKMPSFEETQAIMLMSQNQMVSNQATFGQRLAEAKRVLAEAQRINRQANQPPINQGGPW